MGIEFCEYVWSKFSAASSKTTGTDAAQTRFRLEVEVIHGSLEPQLEQADGIVWPCNCHAISASGIDRVLCRELGEDTLASAREKIMADFDREDGAPLGTVFRLPLSGHGTRCALFAVVFPRRADAPTLAMHSV